MKTFPRVLLFSFLVLGVAVALLNAVGCGRAAEARPLEVTYYYLPG